MSIKLNERLHEAYAKVEALTQEEANRQKKLYDKRSKDVVLNPGDLVLVRIVKLTERHKIQDRWESEEYVVVSQPDPFLPVYKVRPISGGNINTLHRNLLLPLSLQMKSTEDQDSSDIAFDEVRERPLATPEVGIFPDGPSVHPSSENLNLNSEEEASKVDEIPSTDSENLKQTENEVAPEKQDDNTSVLDIDDNLSGLNEFWELVDPNVEDQEDRVSELNFSLPPMDEPVEQKIDRGLQSEQNDSHANRNSQSNKNSEAMKSGYSSKKVQSTKKSEVLKTYPKRSSRNKPKYYGWSSYIPFKWI